MIPYLLGGLALSAVIGLVGYWRGSLSSSGLAGAILTGTLIFGLGGFVWGGLLVAFFVSSSVLSQYRARAKVRLADKFQKGSRRDIGQALANGGWAAALAALFGILHSPLLFIAFVGALATVTADTWATEIGVLSPRPPRLITTGRPVTVGSSGGVSGLGTITAFAGASFIGVSSIALAWISRGLPSPLTQSQQGMVLVDQGGALVLLAGVSGLAGALFDSLLGATWQATYYCDYDGKETERRIHFCGRPTHLLRGYTWIDNDVVNFVSSVLGSGVALVLWSYLFQGS